MGATQLDLQSLELSKSADIHLPLLDPAKPGADLGEILLNVTLQPKSQEDKEQVSDANEWGIAF